MADLHSRGEDDNTNLSLCPAPMPAPFPWIEIIASSKPHDETAAAVSPAPASRKGTMKVVESRIVMSCQA